MRSQSKIRRQISKTEAFQMARRWVVASLMAGTIFSSSFAQGPAKPQTPPRGNAGKAQADTTRKLSEKELKQERARELFADAANAQNNGAYALAIEQWNRLITEFPDDALVPSARHYLGVCFQEQESPDYTAAIKSFKLALEAANLKEREDTLINLGWCLYQQAMGLEGDAQRTTLRESVRTFSLFLDKYSDSSLADKAMFYSGEAETRLGNLDKAIPFFNQLVQSRTFAESPIRPDAIFALGFAYEETNQNKLAKENYDAFLAKYPEHLLANDVRVRAAEIALNANNAQAAIELLDRVIKSKSFATMTVADYVMYRYAYALAKVGRYDESSATYKKLATMFPKSQYSLNAALATGQTLMRDQKYKEAWNEFAKLLPAKDERSAEAAHWMCQIAVIENRPKDAIPVAREALTWAPQSSIVPLLKMDLADGLFATSEGKAEAKQLYEQIAIENTDLPIAPRATYNAAFAALQAGNHADAQRWSEGFAKRFSNDPLAADVAYVRAESLLQLNQHESAITAFEQLLTSAPQNESRGLWELRLATARYLGGQFDKAIEQAKKISSKATLPADKAEALYLVGASELKLQKLNEAQASLKASLAADPKWAQADETMLLLSQVQTQLGQSEEAKATLEKLIQSYPNSRYRTQAEFRLGQFSATAGKFDQALALYERVLAATTDRSMIDFVNYDKAFVYIQQNKIDLALPVLDQVLTSTKNEGLIREAKIAKAICARKVGQNEAAISLLEGLKQQNGLAKSDATKVMYELGIAYGLTKQFDKAITEFEQLIQSDPNNPLIDRVYFELAWNYKSKGDTARANQLFQTVTEKFPNSPLAAESYFHVGQAEFEESKFDRAVKAYTVAATKTSSAELQEKSLYKLGLSLFQQQDYDSASREFAKQVKSFPEGELNIDARFMVAECSLKTEKYSAAWSQYEQARKALEASKSADRIALQVRALIYLHGAQAARELKRWNDVESWIARMLEVAPESSYEYVAKHELAFAKQNQKKIGEAIELYSEVAEAQRNELGARSRFMMGEVYFGDRDFAKAVSEFQKVMYGYGGTQAPADIKNWQARAAFEAGRCSEVLIADLTGERRKKAVDVAKKFYEYLTANHADHTLSAQAKERINVLSR